MFRAFWAAILLLSSHSEAVTISDYEAPSEDDCIFLPDVIEPWRQYMDRFSGHITKTGAGYSKTISGEGYDSATVGLFSCAHFGMTISAKKVSKIHREKVLRMFVDILSQVDPEFFQSMAPMLLMLGNGLTYLESDGPFFMRFSATVTELDDGSLDLELHVMQG